MNTKDNTPDRGRWENLLTPYRLGKEEKIELNDPTRSPFDADYGRIVFSSHFRRLQDKTQVFPLASSDYSRTRLTHSMEVATVGMTLGKVVGRLLEKNNLLPNDISIGDIGTIVAVACLSHDIGNPPFGHSGESAIQHWANKHLSSLETYLTPEEYNDFLRFEGNAQSFRITARLWDRSRKGGAQLMLPSYGALIKYPQGSSAEKDDHNIAGKKFNHFYADLDLFKEVCDTLNLGKNGNRWNRHPLAYVMEAADDICYHIIDIEDAHDAGIVSRDKFNALMRPLVDGNIEKMEISAIRARGISKIVQVVALQIEQNFKNFSDGTLTKSLIDLLESGNKDIFDAIENLKKEAKRHVYTNERVLQVEYAGFKVIGGLLDEFMQALPLDKEGKISDAGKKLLKLLPISHLVVKPEYNSIFDKDSESFDINKLEKIITILTPYQRILALTDYVSGMTDSFALTLYRTLTGMRLPD